jgi:hypothetical protein
VSSIVTPQTSSPEDQRLETRADGITVGLRYRPQHATSELVRRAHTPCWSMASEATDVLVATRNGDVLQSLFETNTSS